MLGIHHILFGWTGAVVLDSLTHVTGPAWLSHPAATTAGLPAEKLSRPLLWYPEQGDPAFRGPQAVFPQSLGFTAVGAFVTRFLPAGGLPPCSAQHEHAG